MTGVEYYRRKMQISICDLSRRTGITATTLQRYERIGIPDHTPVAPLILLADTLNTTLDQLLDHIDGEDLTSRDRKIYTSNIYAPNNLVSNYRIIHNLRYEELAEILLLGSRESARVACRRETARDKHILQLSRYEKISTEELISRYKDFGGHSDV